MVKPPLTLQLEDAKTQGFSSYSNTYPFNYLFGDKELLARQVGPTPYSFNHFPPHVPWFTSRLAADSTLLLHHPPMGPVDLHILDYFTTWIHEF